MQMVTSQHVAKLRAEFRGVQQTQATCINVLA